LRNETRHVLFALHFCSENYICNLSVNWKIRAQLLTLRVLFTYGGGHFKYSWSSYVILKFNNSSSRFAFIIIRGQNYRNAASCLNDALIVKHGNLLMRSHWEFGLGEFNKIDESRGTIFSAILCTPLTGARARARPRGTYLMIGLFAASTLIPEISSQHFIPDICGRSRSSWERVSATVCPEGSVLPIPGQPRWFCQCKLTCQFAQCIAISGHVDVARASACDVLLLSRTRNSVISTYHWGPRRIHKRRLKIRRCWADLSYNICLIRYTRYDNLSRQNSWHFLSKDNLNDIIGFLFNCKML